MELRQLRTFKTVANLLSFNMAAKALNYAQSTISAQIKALEESLGVQLFERLDKHIVLTPAGQKLYGYAGKILDLSEQTEREVGSRKGFFGSFNIRIPETLCAYRLAPAVKSFWANYPDVKLTFSTCNYNDLKQDLNSGLYDLAFLFADYYHSQNLTVKFVGTQKLSIVACPGHELLTLDKVTIQNLKKYPVLLTRTECSYRKMYEQMLSEEHSVPPKIIEVSGIQAIKKWVAQGVGISILPDVSVEEDIAHGVMDRINLSEDQLETAILMIRQRDKKTSDILQILIDTFCDALK